MGNGRDCKCYASCRCQCGCDADWTTDEVRAYKMQIANQAHYIECLLAEIKQLKEAR